MGTSKGYIPPKNQQWKKAKFSVSRMINSSDGTEGVKRAVSEYAKAYSSTHLSNSKAGEVVGNVLGFLLDAKEYGLNEALNKHGLEYLIDKQNDEIFLGLVDYFCEDNSTIEESVIRECIIEVFDDNNIVNFADMDNLDANSFIQSFIIKFIQANFEVAFTEKVQGLCDNIEEAKSRIREVNQYIDDKIRNLYTIDTLINIDWKGKEGIDFINRKCKECYELIMIFEEE